MRRLFILLFAGSLSLLVFTPAQAVSNYYLVTQPDDTINHLSPSEYPELALECAFIFSLNVGDQLPVVDQKDGLVFKGWSYSKNQALVIVDSVQSDTPGILYAYFETADYHSTPKEPIGLRADLYLVDQSDQKLIKPLNFKVNQNSLVPDATEYFLNLEVISLATFELRSVAGVFNDPSITHYPTIKSGKTDGIGFSLSGNTNTFLTVNHVISSGSGDNLMWYQVSSTSDASITFKQIGTYTLYVKIYDNGGWVSIHAQKH